MPRRQNTQRRRGRGAPSRRPARRVRSSFDPRSYSEGPFKPLIVAFTNTVSKAHDPSTSNATWQSITESSIHSGIQSTLQLTEDLFEFRMISMEIWAESYTMSNTGTDIANLNGVTGELRVEFNSLLGVPTSTTTAPPEENRLKVMVDSGTRTRPAHVRFRWPRSHQSQTFLARATTETNFAFWDFIDNSDTGPWTSADQNFYYKYQVRCRILWRSGLLSGTPTRSFSVLAHPRRVTSRTTPTEEPVEIPKCSTEEAMSEDEFNEFIKTYSRIVLKN